MYENTISDTSALNSGRYGNIEFLQLTVERCRKKNEMNPKHDLWYLCI